jgi:putative ABC transport system substrate-binding protein
MCDGLHIRLGRIRYSAEVEFLRQATKMKRREVLVLLGGAGAASLLEVSSASAQARTPVIGWLHSGSANAFARQLGSFRQSLAHAGYIEGQNVAIEYRWADSRPERLPALAGELVRRKVDVIAAVGGNSPTVAARAATKTIPIVFNTGADPVGSGLVSSMNRPGGNITGVSFLVEELGAKTLGLLHELVPAATTVGLMVNPKNPALDHELGTIDKAARSLGLRLDVVRTSTASEIDRAFEELSVRGVGGLVVMADPFFGTRIAQLVELAARRRIPAAYYRREFADAGGLMSYGTSAAEAYRQVGDYVARILKGANPAELPIIQVVKFEFIINLKAAKALNLNVPPALSARADDVIE